MEHSNQPPHHPQPYPPPALGPASGREAQGVLAWVEVVRQPADAAYRIGYTPSSRCGLDMEDDTDSGGGLLEYWRILRRHTTAILLSSLAGLALGVGVGIPMKPVFRARTSLEVLNLNEDFMNMKQASPTTTNDPSYDTSEEQAQAKLLEGDALRK